MSETAELEELGQMHSCQGQGDVGAFTWLGHLFYLILPFLQHLLGAGAGPATVHCTAGVSQAALVRRRKCSLIAPLVILRQQPIFQHGHALTSSVPVPSYHELACYSCPLLGELLEDLRRGCSPLPTPPHLPPSVPRTTQTLPDPLLPSKRLFPASHSLKVLFSALRSIRC